MPSGYSHEYNVGEVTKRCISRRDVSPTRLFKQIWRYHGAITTIGRDGSLVQSAATEWLTVVVYRQRLK